MKIKGLVLFLAMLCTTLLTAQKENDREGYYFAGLSIQDGLSQSSVINILQDKYGFMWFGTRDGLNLYNGNSFEVFRNKINDTTSLSGNIIKAIAEDPEGYLWVATQNGLNRYDRNLGNFSQVPLKPDMAGTGIQELIFDSQNRFWVGGTFGVLCFNEVSQNFEEPKAARQYREQFGNFNVNTILEDAQGNLWLGTGDSKLLNFNPETQEWKQVSLLPGQAVQPRIETLCREADNKIWVGTYGNGLYLINLQGEILQHYHTQAEGRFRISNNNIRDLLSAEGQSLWVGTFDGLNIINQNGETKILKHSEADQNGINHSSIRSLYRDKKGSIWVGTYFGGVNMYDEDNQRFRHYYHKEGQNSLSYNVVGAFAESETGELYIGTERGGLNLFDPGSGKYRQIDDTFNDQSTVKSLGSGRSGLVWAGIFKQGLYYYNSQDSKDALNRFKTSENLPDNTIINQLTVRRDTLWIITDNHGLHQLDLNTGKFVTLPFQENLNALLEFVPIKQLVFRANGNLLLATKGKGIVEINRKTGEIQQKIQYKINKRETAIKEVNALKLVEDKLWIASNGAGIIVFDPKTDHTRQLGTKDNLSNNIVFGFLEDDVERIWAVTLDGINLLDKDRIEVKKQYTNRSGFPIMEVNEGAFYKTQHGDFLIGGNNGFTRFDPTGLKNNNYVPKPILTEIMVMNKPVFPGDDTGVLQDAIQETQRIKLSYFQPVLSIAFATLNYLNPENNSYAYKLEGFDDEWIASENRQTATYTNLKAGDYTFLVKAANNDGVWNNAPRRLQITILPPPWKTWWAYVIYTLLIIGGLYVIRYNAVKSTQLKHDLKIEQLEKQKWKEVHDLKLQYYTDVSHEFRTPLSLILAPLEELLGSREEKLYEQTLLKRMFYNAKRLKLLIDQILELRELETGHTQLKLSPIYVVWYVEEIFSSFETLGRKKNIKMNFSSTNLPDFAVQIDKDKIEKIFYNLFSNAFKFTPKDGNISVHVSSRRQDNLIFYEFEVVDDGEGIPESLQTRIFERFQKSATDKGGTGIGLSLTKSLIDLMQGDIKVESKPTEGTRIRVSLPFKIAKQEQAYRLEASLKYEPLLPIPPIKKNKPEPNTPTERQKLLIVEDNKELRSYLKEKLKTLYEVRSAAHGKSGLHKAQKFGPDLIISDVMMPEMNGFDFCRAVKTSKQLSHIPVILLTAKNSDLDKMEGLKFGADDYLTKPFSWAELQLRIRNILQNRKLLHQRYKNLSHIPLKEFGLFSSYDGKLMQEITGTVEKYMDQPDFSVEFLAKEVGLSRVHLYRKLKALTGETPTAFIKKLRLKKAQQLFKSGAYKPNQVAYMVGFQDVKYFSKCFKKFSGKSPSYLVKETKNSSIN